MHDTSSRAEQQLFWSRHVEGHRSSGLSKAAYCREHDLTYHQFVYWSGKELPSASVVSVPIPNRSSLVPVNLAPTLSSGDLSIRLPTGVVITGVNAGTVDILRSVISTL